MMTVPASMIETASLVDDLDDALAPIFQHLDPKNDFDLGGYAGMYFTTEAGKWASRTPADRKSMLAWFIGSISTA